MDFPLGTNIGKCGERCGHTHKHTHAASLEQLLLLVKKYVCVCVCVDISYSACVSVCFKEEIPELPVWAS